MQKLVRTGLVLAAAVSSLAFAAQPGAAPGELTGAAAAATSCRYPLADDNRPVAPPDAPAERASFTDPTAATSRGQFVRVSHNVYIAPFARLEAQSRENGICIEEAANVQDNTLLKANGGPVDVGAHAIVAHGAEMIGAGTAVSIAHRDACPLPPAGTDPNTLTRLPGESAGAFAERRGRQALANALDGAGADYGCDEVPAFIGFNALNESAISDGSLLAAASRLARGVVLRPGYSSYPGKSLNSQAEADSPGPFNTNKVRFVNAGDIVFMEAVVHVNECLAKGYTLQYRDTARAVHPFGGPQSIHGIGIDPGSYHRCAFNKDSERPTIGYTQPPPRPRDPSLAVSDPNPAKKIRIIGDVRLGDIDKIQDHTSIRADEGEPFGFGRRVDWEFGTTFHALEPEEEGDIREIIVEDDVKIGRRAVIHGGGRLTRFGGFGDEPTELHAGVVIGEESVVFRSDVGLGTRVGKKAVLVGWTNERPGGVLTETSVPDRCVKFEDTPPGECAYFVEW